MKTPIIEGVTQAGLESYLAARQYEAVYWPNFFPVKNVNSLDGKTLIGAVGSRVAAHIISYDSKTPEAGRKSLSTRYFDIPKLAQSRRKSEKEILEHQITKAIRGIDSVIEDYFNDAGFVFDSVQARAEWLSLQAISATKLQLSTTNNPQGIINETVIDFGMPTANKKAVTTVWSTGNVDTMDPIKEFQAVVAAARKLGIRFQRMLMNADTYDLMIASTKFKAFFLNPALSVTNPINLDGINRVLRDYRLPEISVIETSINIEGKDNTYTATDPWSTGHITFVPEIRLGDMFNGPIAEQIEKPDGVLISMQNNVSVSIRREYNPVAVLTKAEANMFPSWPTVDRCFSLYTAATSWA
jgi:hypothetical protein